MQSVDVTRLLHAYGAGDHAALDRLMPVVYDELRAVAHARLRNERAGHTLNTTGLVHEAYLKLVDLDRIRLNDRRHFFALSARLMRQILIDYARLHRAAKRGGGAIKVVVDESTWISEEAADRLLELNDALDGLANEHPRVAEALSHRYFAGLTNEETAHALDVSVPTVERDLRFGRAWLAAQFTNERTAERPAAHPPATGNGRGIGG